MPTLYNVVTAFLAATGCLSLVMSGEINLLMSTAGLAMIPGYYRFLRGVRPADRWVIGGLSILTICVFFFDSLIVSGDVLLAVAHLTIAFQAIKSFDLKEPWDHIQVYFMSLLQLIIASEFTSSLVFGMVFLVFMILLVTAMILSHFLKEGHTERVNVMKPVLVISIITMVTTTFLFVAIPRTPHKFWSKGHVRGIKTSGFSERVEFGAFENMKLDPTVVMRVEMEKSPHIPLYWRGMVMDFFDGTTWRNSLGQAGRIARIDDEFVVSRYDKKDAFEQRIYMEPMDSDVLFGLAEIKGIRADSFTLTTDSARDIHMTGKLGRRIVYTAYSVIGAGHHGVKSEKYLQMPAGMERIGGLAKRIASGARGGEQTAALIERYLKQNYIYSLTPPRPPVGTNPVEEFLFNSKRGYCEHYAASMVLMLRSLGIPSRIVNGFYGGEKNEYGGYIIVRQSDAHSWVEALIDGIWKRFDPTPAVAAPPRPSGLSFILDSIRMQWARYVIGFSSNDQRSILKAVTIPLTLPALHSLRARKMILPAFVFAAILLLTGALTLIYRKWTGVRKHGFVTVQYIALRRMLKRRGIAISPSTTPDEIGVKAVTLGLAREVGEFLHIYQEHRFGPKSMEPASRKRYVALLKEINLLLSRKKRQTLSLPKR